MSGRRLLPILLWPIALTVAGQRLHHARTEFADRPAGPPGRQRADGNSGHAQMDFGGQWVMGRLVAAGHAGELYNRNRQWEVVRAGYPRERGAPDIRERSFPRTRWPAGAEDFRHDDDNLMGWFMGADSPRWADVGRGVAIHFVAVPTWVPPALAGGGVTPDVLAAVNGPALGGPLYPPIHGFLYAPLGAIDDPQRAYFLFQFVAVGFAFLAALGVRVLTREAVSWPLAATVILLYPGVRSGLDLGQNATVTLAVVVWGWVCVTRRRDRLGGAVWGLLAFKPVWAAAFFLVPLLQRRWRFCAAMVLTGAGLAAATLPFVGLHSWLNWLEVGREASWYYSVSQNWISLSRDLFGLPRRFLIDFALPREQRGSVTADWAARVLWAAVFGLTVVTHLRRDATRNPTGGGAAFLFFGGYLTCYHFMYYDAVLSSVGFAVVFGSGTARLDRAVLAGVLGGLLVLENWLVLAAFGGRIAGVTFDTGIDYAWDTAGVLAAWGWCGVRLWRR